LLRRRRNTATRPEHGSAVSELFDDAEPEIDSLAEAMDDFDKIEIFQTYVRDGLNELQDWLREQPIS
jgi:hypothetical protein